MHLNNLFKRVAAEINNIRTHPVFGILKESPKRYTSIAINSTVLYVLTYLVALVIYQTATVMAASSYNIQLIDYYDHIFFLTTGKSLMWNKDSILTVFSSGPLVSVYFCAIFLVIFLTKYSKEVKYKLMLVWAYLQLINRIICVFAVGLVLTLWGSNLLIDWLYVDKSMKILFFAFSLILLLIVGRISVGAFLYTASSPMLLKNNEKRLAFLIAQVFIPAVMGNIILFILLLPNINYLELLVALSTLIMIIPVFFSYKKFRVIDAITIINERTEDKYYSINRRYVIILLVFYIVYRLTFIRGILVT